MKLTVAYINYLLALLDYIIIEMKGQQQLIEYIEERPLPHLASPSVLECIEFFLSIKVIQAVPVLGW